MRRPLIALAALLLTACGAAPAPSVPVGWTIDAPPGIPASYVASVEALALEVEGFCPSSYWGGVLTIVPAAFACPGSTTTSGWCSGATYGPQDSTVAYDPAEGLGPDASTTAAAWELCNARIESCYGVLMPETHSPSTADCVAWLAAHP